MPAENPNRIERAPLLSEQNPRRPFPGPCDHPDYAMRSDAFDGGRSYCSMCGVRSTYLTPAERHYANRCEPLRDAR